jgi:hypothetical protein
MSEGNLYDFTETPPAPKIKCRAWIPHPTEVGQRVGTIGHDVENEVDVALFLHRREDHEQDDGSVRKKTYNTEFGGYAISTWLLDLLEDRGIDTIYIAVTDEDVLYQFSVQQYRDGIDFEWRDGDPQAVTATANAMHDWPGGDIQMTDPDDANRLNVNHKHLSGEGI